MRDGRIVAVGPATTHPVPADATRVDCEGLFVVAGFQNSHVHFTEAKWEDAAKLPAAQLSAQLEDMLLRWGVTTVVDTGSLLSNTLALRARIESGEVRGPRIYTVGTPIYPHNGIPYYLRESLPPEVLQLLNTPQTGAEAAAITARQIEAGADALKLFTGSWVERGKVLPMDAAIARAAADEAHARGKLVFAHASNVAGLEPALEARVDVLAHALDDDRGWNETHVARMKAIRMAMIPTLKLFGGQSFTKYIQAEVGTYAKAGGQILFGTDVGFLTDYDTTDEFALMAGAGLDWRAILASLTTATGRAVRRDPAPRARGRRSRRRPGRARRGSVGRRDRVRECPVHDPRRSDRLQGADQGRRPQRPGPMISIRQRGMRHGPEILHRVGGAVRGLDGGQLPRARTAAARGLFAAAEPVPARRGRAAALSADAPRARHHGGRLRVDLRARHGEQALAGPGSALRSRRRLLIVPIYMIYYVVQPMPGNLVVKQIVFDGILLLVLGAIVAWLYRAPVRT